MAIDTRDKSLLKPLMLIPAAGFGVRVGQPEAKELLPLRDGRPLIELPLRLAAERDWAVHVITRAAKVELVEYLKDFPKSSSFIHIQLVEPTADWPDSLLMSEPFWHLYNLVVLPDTSWQPINAMDQVMECLKRFQVAWGEHQVSSMGTWGTLQQHGPQHISLCEKPNEEGGGWAWGLFGFQRQVGRMLLEAQSRSSASHQWQDLSLTSAKVKLEGFRDLTRSP